MIGDQLTLFRRSLPDSLNEVKCGLMKDKMHWTSQGTIDKKSTVQALADATDLDVETRFQIAVTFRLEDRVNQLSSQMPTDYLSKNRN